MTTTYATDDDVYLRSPLVGAALVRVNALRAEASAASVAAGGAAIAATTVDAYRVEAQRQILALLLGRGITEGMIGNAAALLEPEALLCAALLFEAASVRDDAVQGQVDVFAGQGRTARAKYNNALASANPLGASTRPTGRTFTWGRR